jgi:hypothetical protein
MGADFNKETEKVQAKQPTGLSYWPISLAVGMLLIVIGIVSTLVISGVGLLLVLASIAGWVDENSRRQENEL